MRRLYKFPDVVSVAIRKKVPKDALNLLNEYNKGINNIAKTLAKRMDGYIKTIAPFNYGDMGGDKGRLKNDINVEAKELNSFGGMATFTAIKAEVNSQSRVKAIVQEFGYPKGAAQLGDDSNALQWNPPYKPNPKRKKQYASMPGGRIKGLGYMRVGTVLAANSLRTDKPTIFNKPPINDVRNFKNVVTSMVNSMVAKYTLAFAKGNKSGVPKYITNKVQFPEQSLVSKYTSNLKAERVSFPLLLQVTDEDGGYVRKSGTSRVGGRYRV